MRSFVRFGCKRTPLVKKETRELPRTDHHPGDASADALGLDLAGSLVGLALGAGLEATVTKLGRGADPLERDLFERGARRVGDERLAEGDGALDDARARTLDHDPVVLDDAVADKATDGGDGLLGDVKLGRGRALVVGLADAVDLLVDLGTVVVTVLTGTGDRVHDGGRVPGTDTRDLAETLVGLARELLGAPTVGDTLEPVTLRDTDNVDVLVLLKDGRDVDRLFKVRLGKVDLVGDRAAVDLDLHQVRLLLREARLADLGVGEDADDRAVLGDALELARDRRRLALLGVLLGVLGERLLLGAVPVLVEPALDLVREVLGPHGRERAETARRLDVADDADNDHRRRLDDRNSLDDLLLVHLRARAVKVADNVGHAGLVAKEGRQVNRRLGVVLGEALRLSAVAGSPLTGEEPEGTATGVLVLPVRHPDRAVWRRDPPC